MERIIPAAPNWYCSKCSDFNEAGQFVYTAKATVYIYYISSIDGSLTYKNMFKGHKERVAALSLCQSTQKATMCVSGSDDGCLKFWDINTLEVIAEHSKHTSKISCVSCSPVLSTNIVSGDDKGNIVFWNLETLQTDIFCPEKLCIFSIAFSTQDQNVAAVGYQTGLILLVNVADKGKVLFRLRGHDDEIHSLSWSTVPGEAKPGDASDSVEATSGCLLASGCRDNSIILWSTYRGKSLSRLKLPTNSRVKRDRYDNQNRSRTWLTVKWVPGKQYQLASSSFHGDLLLWDLTQSGKDKFQQLPLSPRSHYRIVFNLSFGGYDNNIMVSLSQDRQIITWDMTSLQGLLAMPTLGGYVYNIAACPINPGRLALGVGDCMIRVWNSENQQNKYDVFNLWQGIRSKVTALAWHPVKENLLALGTEDGRVGIYDVLVLNGEPNLATTYCNRTVYVVCWGPSIGSSTTDGTLSLYSVGDGRICAYNPKKMTADPVNLGDHINLVNNISNDDPDKTHSIIRSELSFSPDKTFAAIGNDNGSVEIYDSLSWKLLVLVRVCNKLINIICWHPLHTVASPDSTKYTNWLGIASNECVIRVVDLSEILAGEPAANVKDVGVISESCWNFQGHKERVVGLTWSPHQDELIVSASYDGYAQVWDVSNGQPISNFYLPQNRLLSVHWSYLDSDLIMVGAENNCLYEWRVSAHVNNAFAEVSKKKKKKFRSTPKSTAAVPQVDVVSSVDHPSVAGGDSSLTLQIADKDDITKTETYNEQSEDIINDLKAQLEASRRKILLQSAGIVMNKVDQATQTFVPILETEDVREKAKRRRRNARSIFPIFTELMNNRERQYLLKDVLSVAKLVYEDGMNLDNENAHLGVFLDRRSAFKFMKQESELHLENNSMDNYLQIEIWKGNINGAIKFAKENEQLTDWLVSMTPLASQGLWKQTAYDYARQLESDGHFHKSAIYFLCADRVYEAIDMFSRHKLYKEAVMLAKVRLSPFDPLVEELYVAWALKLTKDGQSEQAAKCYLAIKKSKDASRLLAQKTDEASLQTATYVSFIAKDQREGWIHAQRLVTGQLLAGEWDKVHAMTTQHTHLQMFCLLACVHESLVRQLSQLVPDQTLAPSTCRYSDWTTPKQNFALPEFMLDESACNKVCVWQPRLVGTHTLPHFILRIWYQHLDISLDSANIHSMYNGLEEISRNRQTQSHVNQIMIHTAYDMTLCLLSFLLSDTTSAIKHMNRLLSDLYTSSQHDVLYAVCRVLLPQGPEYMLKLQHEVTALRVIVNMESNSTSYDQPSIQQTTTKFWSEPKNNGEVSNSSSRCKDLDCLRVYYYLTILQYVQTSLETKPAENDKICEHSDTCKLITPNGNSSNNSACSLNFNDSSNDFSKENIVENGHIHSDCSNVTKNRIINSVPDVIPDMEQTEITSSKELKKDECKLNESSKESDLLVERLNSSNLYHIARCVLWDVQARHSALKETLGYIHKALSQIMLKQTQHNAQPVSNIVNVPHEKVKTNVDSHIQSNSNCVHACASLQECSQKDIFNLRDYKSIDYKDSEKLLSQKKPKSNKPTISFEEGSDSPEQNGRHSSSRRRNIISNVTNGNDEENIIRDYPEIPSFWMDVPIEERYSQPYMTQMILEQEEEFISGELKSGFDFIQPNIPNALTSCRRLIDVTKVIPHIDDEQFVDKLCTWALQYAVLSEDITFFTDLQKQLTLKLTYTSSNST